MTTAAPQTRPTSPLRSWPGSWPAAATAGLALVAFAAYLTLSLARWYRWANPSWDLAIFEQAVRGYAHLGAPIVTIKGADFNQLGDHFSPLLVLLAPFYRLFPTPVTLLVAQCVLVAVSVVPVTAVARRILGTWRGLALGTAYAFSWGIQAAVDVQFHEYALAVPLLAFGLAAFLDGRWRASAVWIVLLLGVKEDLGLTVAAFGLVLWLRGQRRLGAVVAGTGVLGMALVVGVLVPALNPDGRYDYWGRLDEDGSAGSTGLVASAVRLVGDLLVPAVKIETLALLLVVTAFVALRSPLVLLAVPTILWRFAGSVEFYWGTTWHYSLILVPILFAAAIDGLRTLEGSRFTVLRRYARAAPALMLLVAAVLLPRFPLADLWEPGTYARSDRVEVGQRAVASIPEGASVASDLGLILQLTTHHEVYWLGGVPEVAPDYVALDLTGWGGNPPDDVEAYTENVYRGASYEVVFDEWGYVVAKRLP
ncbi:DUF2079 domain-containing protein [Sanguibacter antarcticus]|uniref:Putative membrane protein DUF2079 n=1 Tax=Sanguibacter antarcticus TaxID=372484 RepID=A0A2A9E2V4_9MICO|nr:DUF2079 domain-containing protein [Sanguibacter antarcticus]PFG32685.1 putative membrane protein DUF2079 [Sanguibacter antarcticus]